MTVETDQQVAQSVSRRIEAIVAAAESETREHHLRIQAETERHAAAERATLEAELEQLRAGAEAEVERYLAEAKRQIDDFGAQRLNSITALTDRLIEHADRLRERFETAETVRRQVYGLIAAIGEVAERLTDETYEAQPELPRPVVPRTRTELPAPVANKTADDL